jgi:GLPGLI family protein
MKNILATLLLITSAVSLFAQTEKIQSIVFKGKITYERKYNNHKALDKMMEGNSGNSSYLEIAKKQSPKYKTDIFELLFTQNNSIYKAAKDGITESKMMMGNIPAENNIVFNNYEKQQVIAQKKIFEKNYLVTDSFKNCKWKITEEFRKIAGYNCRRAETIIMDSVYVIAYYCDAFIAEGGPESFTGLPGMILGVVMPRLNVTYFATKIDPYLTEETLIVAPKKGSATTMKDMEKSLRKDLTQWGEYVNQILWFANL